MPRFELGRAAGGRRLPWAASLALHVVAAVLALVVAWQAPRRRVAPRAPEVTEWIVVPPPGGRATTPPPAAGSSRRVRGVVEPPAVARADPLNVPLRAPTTLPRADAGPLVMGPHVGDGRLWVNPRPALPNDVAERLYGDTTGRDSVAMSRLHAMLDTLNKVLDREQRERRRPTWSTEIRGIPFGLDSQFITIAGIKIPTMALAFLGDLLPPGNYDEALRARALEQMRQDLLRAAQRAETFQDFQRYVKELRRRKQAERDAERRRREPPDTSGIIP